MKGKIFVVSAPSGAGKTSLLKRIFNEFPDLMFSVSATTRKARHNEKDGVDYLFCSRKQFKDMIKNNKLAEWREVHGNLYGTPIEPVKEIVKKGRNIILDIDVFGKSDFDRIFPKNTGILILPPSFKELEHRLRSRGTDSDEAVAKRLKNARLEMNFAKKHGIYKYTVVNDDFEQALKGLIKIIRNEGNW